MSNESKCNCRHCNGHIAFPPEMAGQSINCPHCQLETVLFIPHIATTPIQPSRTGKLNTILALVVAVVLFASLLGAFFLSKEQAEQRKPTNLKPAAEAFGWKLGDRLPEQFRSEVRNGYYQFRPRQETPPFDNCQLGVTDDGRIYLIEGTGYPPDYGQDSYAFKNALISLLSEKYGLRSHNPNELNGKQDVYEFGTESQSVRLEVFERNLLTLRYYDKRLQNVSYDEQETKRKKDEDDTKAALKRSL